MTAPRHDMALDWGLAALTSAVQTALPGAVVQAVSQVASTNTALLELGRRTEAPLLPGLLPHLLVAEQQTQGRGRLGRAWHASPGASLTFSLALPLAPQSWNGLSLAVGLALARALEPEPGNRPRIGLKWPNDLWLWEGPGQGRKLGGVLIETAGSAVGAARWCVVGVGLNVRAQPLHGPSAGSACLEELSRSGAAEPTAPGVLATVAPALARALRTFQAQGFAPLLSAYAERDVLHGQAVATLEAGMAGLHGVAEGVTADGALRLRAGALHHVVSGEVSVRLQVAAPAQGAVSCALVSAPGAPC